MHVHVFEWNFASEVLGHHDHTRDPEKDDVVARNQYR